MPTTQAFMQVLQRLVAAFSAGMPVTLQPHEVQTLLATLQEAVTLLAKSEESQ